MEYSKIRYVEALENYNILIIFENGETKIYSAKGLLKETAFSPLKSEKLFNQVKRETSNFIKGINNINLIRHLEGNFHEVS